MRVSVKGRYALAAMIEIARHTGQEENIAAVSIAATLGISKIYLEQAFTQLKKAGLILSAKGSRGGYQLARSTRRITAWDILSAMEAALFDPAETTVAHNAPEIETAMQLLVFVPLDAAAKQTLSAVTLQDLLDAAERQRSSQAFMLNM
ncbi:MAG: Rrf2 family transcriptional regulator [Oscillospiraceae bacterium]|jgi:Rrf2 family protein|nr:Rrf2 family transcriptional regulator [Oscillospiraceae bacterium]